MKWDDFWSYQYPQTHAGLLCGRGNRIRTRLADGLLLHMHVWMFFWRYHWTDYGSMLITSKCVSNTEVRSVKVLASSQTWYEKDHIETRMTYHRFEAPFFATLYTTGTFFVTWTFIGTSPLNTMPELPRSSSIGEPSLLMDEKFWKGNETEGKWGTGSIQESAVTED